MASTNEHPAVVPKVNCMKVAPPHLLMVPYPTQPHILPMLSLARQIASHGGVKITYVCHQTLIDRLLRSESTFSDSIQFVGVPDELPGFSPPSEFPETPIVLRESLQLGYCMGPFVDKLLQDQDQLQGPTCMITDLMHWWGIDVAAKLSIPRYILSVNPALFLQLLLNCPMKGYIFDDEDGFIRVPALPPFQNHHLPLACRKEVKGEPFLTRCYKSAMESDGVLVNTCLALEAKVIEAVRDSLQRDIPVLPVGPLALSLGLFSKSVSMEGLQLSDEKTIIDWLGDQPPLSVLYVSFGTTGLFNLAKQHVAELARGLEASGQRFLWVFRAPSGVDENNPELLPPGFEERVKGRALLLRGWAPQLKILAHPSTGAFLSSCGWNSAVESVALGVPLIGWPSFADQPAIARYLEGGLKVAITLPFRDDLFVEAEDFVKAINVVLQSEEGKAMRERMCKYKTSIGAQVLPGGSSHAAIQEFANLIKCGSVST
ncbi:unnamed protein product [Calypogeia fissa]